MDGLAFDDAEPDLDQVQPRSRRGGEVDVDAGVRFEPGFHVRVLVGGVVVHDQMQLPVRVGTGEVLEEGKELGVAVPVLAQPGHLAGRHLRAANKVVCRAGRSRGCAARRGRAASAGSSGSGSTPGFGFSRPHRERSVLRWRQVQPDDVGDLGLQLRIRGELERLGLPRLDPVVLPDRGDGGVLQPRRAASSRDDQCVTPRLAGGGVKVDVITAARSTVRGRPGRFWVSSPARPRSAYRDRHRFTVGRVTPTRSAIS